MHSYAVRPLFGRECRSARAIITFSYEEMASMATIDNKEITSQASRKSENTSKTYLRQKDAVGSFVRKSFASLAN